MKFNTEYYRLDNGVRVLLVPMPSVESVTTMILAKTGSRNEEESQAGISHILEHMCLKGTKKYPDQLVLSSAIDSMGAEHNAFTGKEYTGYYITAASRHMEKSLEILSDAVTEPLLRPENLATELGVIVEEYNMFEDLPMRRSIEEFENLMYEGTPMGRFIEGSPETIKATTSEDLRKYMKRWYKGGNMLVVMAGKIGNQDSRKQVKSLIEEYLGGVEKGDVDPFVSPAKFGKMRTKHIKKNTEQAHFMVGVPGISMQDPRRYALSIAQVVLGGPMSSRLFTEIREKRGLAYYVRAEAETESDTGYFGVRSGVKLDKLSEAIEVVTSEMYNLADTFSEKELKLGKDYLLGKLPLQLEGSMDVAQFLGMRALITDEVRQPDEAIKAIESVTIEDVREIVSELVQEGEMRRVVLGPGEN